MQSDFAEMIEGLDLDRFHAIVFPNNLRSLRRQRGFHKLMALSKSLPEIPYVRISKIERGEVLPKADELISIAGALGVAPDDLLVDIADASFSLPDWASEIMDTNAPPTAGDALSLLLAAAVRMRRATDETLTIARIESEFGLPPVSLSRLENATKPFDRINPAVMEKLCALFEVPDVDALVELLLSAHRREVLLPYLSDVRSASQREARTIAHTALLRSAFGGSTSVAAQKAVTSDHTSGQGIQWGARGSSDGERPATAARLLTVFGSPLPDGLVARTAIERTVEAPRGAGQNAWAMLVCRPTLGMGLPGRAVVVVDPDRFPAAGGLAVVEEGEGFRLLAVTADRNGALFGYSERPEREVAMDDLDIGRVAAVISAYFE